MRVYIPLFWETTKYREYGVKGLLPPSNTPPHDHLVPVNHKDTFLIGAVGSVIIRGGDSHGLRMSGLGYQGLRCRGLGVRWAFGCVEV